MDSFTLICDWPGCDADVLEGHDYSGFGQIDYLYEIAEDGGWQKGQNRQWYCEQHPTEWASDHEDGEPYPDGMYLLIHDGDGEGEDGTVTLKNHYPEIDTSWP